MGTTEKEKEKPQTAATSAASASSSSVMVKYMGSADVAIVEQGETFDGRYPAGLGRKLVFDKSNRFVLDLGDIPKEAVDLLLEDSERFKDVSTLKRVPSNLNQKIFGGHRASEAPEDAIPPA